MLFLTMKHLDQVVWKTYTERLTEYPTLPQPSPLFVNTGVKYSTCCVVY